MFPWNIRVPRTEDDFCERDEMLNNVIRSQIGGSICDEYPLVLGREKSRFSYCMFRLDARDRPCELIAHLNYFPREIIDQSGRLIGSIVMIANVSTKESYRGKGIMSEFIRLMQDRVRLEGHSGILLWSDQDLFYQKRGFNKVGQEYRIQISKEALHKTLSKRPDFSSEKLSKIEIHETCLLPWNHQDLKSLLKRRYPVMRTLGRSLDEYQNLLKIPGISIAYQKNQLDRGFVLMNRGSDMQGAVHEWGAADPFVLEEFLLKLMQEKGMEEILVLAPVSLSQDYLDQFYKVGSVEKNTLGYYWSAHGPLKQTPLDEESGFFVWGMDSI